MASRRRHIRRRTEDIGEVPINIRVGSRRNPKKFTEIRVTSARDAARFARLIDNEVQANPRDQIIVAIDGHQYWLEEVLSSCIEDYWSDISELNREVQFAGTAQFPQRASKRAKWVPWTFIVDEMNVPSVYWWSFGYEPPVQENEGLLSRETINEYRLRIGVWTCGRGACRFDPEVSVTIIFTQPTPVSEHVVTEALFPYLYKDDDYDQPKEDEEGVCWIFSRLYWLLTDWQNIIRESVERLDEAELNSRGRNLPVKLRTRTLHKEVNRLYELTEFLHFHLRAFKKLVKLKADVPKQEQQDPLWGDMDDAVDDLDQASTSLDLLKERFNNLIELEFNIENATQSDNSRFLNVVATLFLPVSFLSGVFGITTITWPAIWYLWAAIPIVIISLIFTIAFIPAVRFFQKLYYPYAERRLPQTPRNYTMLGDGLPDSVDVPGGNRPSRPQAKAQRPAGLDGTRERSQSRTRSRSRGGYEKRSGY